MVIARREMSVGLLLALKPRKTYLTERSEAMVALFVFQHRVQEHEIDDLGHVNNVAFLDWMQQAAIAHSAKNGWSSEDYHRIGRGWVAKSHKIEYHAPAYLDEEILVHTWVASMQRVSSVRRFRIYRKCDNILLAEAETLWAFVNYETGKLVRIPDEVASCYIPMTEGVATP